MLDFGFSGRAERSAAISAGNKVALVEVDADVQEVGRSQAVAEPRNACPEVVSDRASSTGVPYGLHPAGDPKVTMRRSMSEAGVSKAPDPCEPVTTMAATFGSSVAAARSAGRSRPIRLRHGNAPVCCSDGQPTGWPAATVRIRSATASGWDSIETWDASISVTSAPALAAMARCADGG